MADSDNFGESVFPCLPPLLRVQLNLRRFAADSLHLTLWWKSWTAADGATLADVIKWIYLCKLPIIQSWYILMDYLAGGVRSGVRKRCAHTTLAAPQALILLCLFLPGPSSLISIFMFLYTQVSLPCAGLSANLGYLFPVCQRLNPDVLKSESCVCALVFSLLSS